MLSYSSPYFDCDIIISFFFLHSVKIIIGGVQLRSFTGLGTHLYNVSESVVLRPLLIYCYMYKDGSFTCCALPCNVLFSKTGPLKGDLQFISIAITLLLSQWDLCGEDKNFFFMSRSESSHFMPTFLWLFKQNGNIGIQFQPFSSSHPCWVWMPAREHFKK